MKSLSEPIVKTHTIQFGKVLQVAAVPWTWSARLKGHSWSLAAFGCYRGTEWRFTAPALSPERIGDMGNWWKLEEKSKTSRPISIWESKEQIAPVVAVASHAERDIAVSWTPKFRSKVVVAVSQKNAKLRWPCWWLCSGFQPSERKATSQCCKPLKIILKDLESNFCASLDVLGQWIGCSFQIDVELAKPLICLDFSDFPGLCGPFDADRAKWLGSQMRFVKRKGTLQ